MPTSTVNGFPLYTDGGRVTAAKNSALISFFRPLSKSSEPIGEMQSVGGAMILVFFMPLIRCSTCSLPISRGLLFGIRLEFWQISFAVFGPTLENSRSEERR